LTFEKFEKFDFFFSDWLVNFRLERTQKSGHFEGVIDNILSKNLLNLQLEAPFLANLPYFMRNFAMPDWRWALFRDGIMLNF
jgi:hypothetical protein